VVVGENEPVGTLRAFLPVFLLFIIFLIDFAFCSSYTLLDNQPPYHVQLIMVDESSAIIATFAFGWLCRSILLRPGGTLSSAVGVTVLPTAHQCR
jgi:hypothetical protein